MKIVILLLICLVKVISQHSKAFVSLDFMDKLLRENFNLFLYNGRILCPSQLDQGDILIADPNIIIEAIISKESMNFYGRDGVLELELKDIQVQSRFNLFDEKYVGTYLATTNFYLRIDFPSDGQKGLQIFLQKISIFPTSQRIEMNNEYKDFPGDFIHKFAKPVEGCLLNGAQEVVKTVNSMLENYQSTNISGIRNLNMYEICKLAEVEEHQINFLCNYPSKQQKRLLSEETFPQLKVSKGYTQYFSKNLLDYTIKEATAAWGEEKAIKCNQAAYLTLVYNFEQYAPGITKKIKESPFVKCQVKKLNNYQFKVEGDRYKLSAQNVTAYVGSTSNRSSDDFIEKFVGVQTNFNLGLQMEIEEAANTTLKFKVVDLKVDNTQIVNGIQLPKIEKIFNAMAGTFYPSLTQKSLRRGISIGSSMYKLNNPKTHIDSESGSLVVQVENPVF